MVSLVPSQTELLADLGLDAEVVGLTRFCVHPEGWNERKQIVGGTKNVRVDRVRELAPDLVIANKEENVREQVEALQAIAPVFVTDVPDVDGALRMTRSVGGLVDRAAEADRLADAVAAGFARLGAEAEGAVPLRALYLIWRDPWMTVGDDTIIADVLRRGGVENAAVGHQRYPTLSPDQFAALAPDVVLLSSEPYPFGPAHVAEVQALAPRAQVELVDGEPFSWYGSRLLRAPDALDDLRRRLAAG
ncbi:hypothetical protein BSZ37_19870 [Rubrivirga marina]|uniref:Fe/B12 periplasmic-binding domain-containing protein n=1 Tax=Rubrivirga marina TaxID=1196024 RepID=A0A271J6E6_9BACT|nr:hypothetical protein BSZ37_19870 [Rubrivirga marina]